MTNIFFLVINGESREGLGRGLGRGGGSDVDGQTDGSIEHTWPDVHPK